MIYLYHVNTFSYQELTSQITVGRTTGDLVYDGDGRMSGKHAQFTLEDDQVYVEDLGSKNRTAVNRVEIPPGQKIKIKNFTFLEIGSQQFILTDNKNLSLQHLNEVMEHHMSKAIVKLEIERTKTGLRTPDLPKDELASKEAILLQLQKEIMSIETTAKAELAKLDLEREKIITQAKNKKAELMTKAQSLKAEVDQQKAEAQRIRAELEQKKKKIINLKDLPTDDEVSTEKLPE